MSTTVTKRASLEELQEFANKVREAGGGNPLDALMPAVPEDTTRCLIAKNLNFNCEVDGVAAGSDAWAMWLEDEGIRDSIATALDLDIINREEEDSAYGVVLPPQIGQVAADFDRAGEILSAVDYDLEYTTTKSQREASIRKTLRLFDQEERQLVRELAPYVEASEEEARSIATVVNEDGSIVV